MDKKAVLERITATGVIPVIRAQSADEAASAIAAIQKGGV
jgi:2-keto-3-deoxy-6-phosphogluconate aldolase